MQLRKALRMFDPTTAPSTVAGALTHGRSWPFFIDGYESRRQVSRLLDSHGIDNWGWGGAPNGDLTFAVKRDDGRRAEALMIANGITVTGRRLT